MTQRLAAQFGRRPTVVASMREVISMFGTYSFADAELDEARFELRRHGAHIMIQPKVMRLLIYLVRHRDRVVPGDELLDVLWHGETVCRGSLKRAVRLARRALGDDGERQTRIRTVRTYGYQFVAPVACESLQSLASAYPTSLGEGARSYGGDYMRSSL